MFKDFNGYIEGINLAEVFLWGGLWLVVISIIFAFIFTLDNEGETLEDFLVSFVILGSLITLFTIISGVVVVLVKVGMSPVKESVFIDGEGRNLKTGIVVEIEEIDNGYNETKTTEITLEDGSKVYTPTDNELNKYVEEGDALKYKEHNLYTYKGILKDSKKEGTINVAILSFENKED